jgi:hypothetical protein
VTSEVESDHKLKTLEPAKSTNMVGVGALVEQLRVKRNEKHILSQSLDVTGLSKVQPTRRLKTARNLDR